MSSKKKSSILISNYNNETYLDRCITSCKRQKYENLEIIVHDDISTDNSQAKLKSCSGIKNFFNEKKTNKPFLDAMNGYKKIYTHSSGEYIFLLDSDDYFLDNKVLSIINLFEKNIDVDFIQDIPTVHRNGTYKKNSNNFYLSRWPFFSPTSCLAFRKAFFEEFLIYIEDHEMLYENVWLDFRLCAFAYFKSKKFLSLDKSFTIYEQSLVGNEAKKYGFLGKNWIKRRYKSHLYVNFLEGLKNKNNNIDASITKIIYKIFD